MSTFELPNLSSRPDDPSIDGSMAAVEINWRPLGELFLEHGLITRDELEDALAAQAETKERLGQVLVGKGLVSEPELLKVLIDQLGLELEQEGGPGRLAHDVAERRALRSLESVPKATEPDGVDPADPISAARASFEAALVAERTQLEAPLNDAREALQASLTASPPEPGTATPEAPVEPSATDPETSATPVVVPTPLLIPSPEESHMDESQPVNVSLLVRQAEELREELARESAFHATALEEATRELDTRVTDLQAELAHEREQHEQVAAALERAQRDARREASELRAAVNRLKSELAQIDAATGWFEYWSGAAGRKPNA